MKARPAALNSVLDLQAAFVKISVLNSQPASTHSVCHHWNDLGLFRLGFLPLAPRAASAHARCSTACALCCARCLAAWPRCLSWKRRRPSRMLRATVHLLMLLLTQSADALVVAVSHAAGRMGVSVVGQLREQWKPAATRGRARVLPTRRRKAEPRRRKSRVQLSAGGGGGGGAGGR